MLPPWGDDDAGICLRESPGGPARLSPTSPLKVVRRFGAVGLADRGPDKNDLRGSYFPACRPATFRAVSRSVESTGYPYSPGLGAKNAWNPRKKARQRCRKRLTARPYGWSLRPGLTLRR